jgi:sigma-70-like protein
MYLREMRSVQLLSREGEVAIAQIGAQAGVISDAPAGAILLGSPAQSRQEFFRQVATLNLIKLSV